MSMIFCHGCGKEIHETALTCPSCGALQSASKDQLSTMRTPNIEQQSISDSWRVKFDLLEKAGGVKLPNVKKLPFGERMKVGFNIWASYLVHFTILRKVCGKRQFRCLAFLS